MDLKRALRLSALSIVWSGIASSVAVCAALVSGSLSLLGFGADAMIDSVASVVLVLRFTVESRQPNRAERVERAAERIAGLALSALALYLAFGAVRALAAQAHPETSLVSLGLSPSCRRWPSPSTASPLVSAAALCAPTASAK